MQQGSCQVDILFPELCVLYCCVLIIIARAWTKKCSCDAWRQWDNFCSVSLKCGHGPCPKNVEQGNWCHERRPWALKCRVQMTGEPRSSVFAWQSIIGTMISVILHLLWTCDWTLVEACTVIYAFFSYVRLNWVFKCSKTWRGYRWMCIMYMRLSLHAWQLDIYDNINQ